jgi:ribosome modulation factor
LAAGSGYQALGMNREARNFAPYSTTSQKWKTGKR